MAMECDERRICTAITSNAKVVSGWARQGLLIMRDGLPAKRRAVARTVWEFISIPEVAILERPHSVSIALPLIWREAANFLALRLQPRELRIQHGVVRMRYASGEREDPCDAAHVTCRVRPSLAAL